MGCDIQLFTEGLLKTYVTGEKQWINIDRWYRKDGWAEYMITENEGFHYTDLIDGHRDYGLFYLLAGVRGNDNENSYLPIAKAKGVPEQMDLLIKNHYKKYFNINIEQESIDCHHASYLTLKELKDSGYGGIMRLKGWVKQDEYNKAMCLLEKEEKYQLWFRDIKDQNSSKHGLVLKDWNGYLNLNLTAMIEGMEKLETERKIENDEEIRVVFGFDN